MQIEYAPHLFEDFKTKFGTLERKAKASATRRNNILKQMKRFTVRGKYPPCDKDLLIANYNLEAPVIELKKIVYNLNQRMQCLGYN